MKPFDDFHTFTHRHGPNAKSQVATEDKMVVNVSGSILQVKLSTAYCTVYTTATIMGAFVKVSSLAMSCLHKISCSVQAAPAS